MCSYWPECLQGLSPAFCPLILQEKMLTTGVKSQTALSVDTALATDAWVHILALCVLTWEMCATLSVGFLTIT